MAGKRRVSGIRLFASGAGILFLSVIEPLAMDKAQEDHTISISSGWKIQKAESAKDLENKFSRADFDDSSWENANLPDKDNPPYMDRVILYRRWVAAPAGWKGKKIEVSFDGSWEDECVVCVNGQKQGGQEGKIFKEFSLDVTDAVKCGETNLVAVLCENKGGRGGVRGPACIRLTEEAAKAKAERETRLREELKLKEIPYKIVYQGCHGNEKHWDLYMINADGASAVNLTQTPDADEMVPRASPDGTKICFFGDEQVERKRIGSVYYMNADGTGRTKVADDADFPCWSPDGKKLAYLKKRFNPDAGKGLIKQLVIYDLESRKHEERPPDERLRALGEFCWSPADWLVARKDERGGHLLLIEVKGAKILEPKEWGMKGEGCRPDWAPDGKRLAWNMGNESIGVVNVDLTGPEPRVKMSDATAVLACRYGYKLYHGDWSPDARRFAFSYGNSGEGHQNPETKSPGWNICVGDPATGKWIAITAEGGNKEPDWVPVASPKK